MKNLLFVLTLILSNLAIGQVSYTSSYHQNVGNPGGLNTQIDNDTWSIIFQHTPVNQWISSTPIPIPFVFYGDTVTSFQASQNGVITFSNPGTVPGSNTNLPSTQLPDKSICAFWDTHYTNYGYGIFGTTVFGAPPYRQFWIKWSDWPIGGSIEPTFSIVLEETSNKIYIIDQNNIGSMSSTVGIQKNTANYTQYGNDNIAPSSNSLFHHDNSYYEFTPNLVPDISPQTLSNNSYDFCGTNDSIPLNVSIINNGLQTSNVFIDAYLSGAVNINLSKTYTDTLFMNVPTNVYLGKVPVSSIGTVDVTIVTTKQGDNNPQNDTLQQTITIQNLIESTGTIQDETISGANDGSIMLSIAQGTAPYSVIWNDGQTGTTIQNLSPGNYTATITDANSCLLVSSYQVLPGIMTSNLDVKSIKEIDFHLYPNPTQRFITVEIKSTNSNDVLVELISMDGRVLEHYDQQNIQFNKMELDLSAYLKGIYLVKVRKDGNERVKKLVIL